MTVKCLLANHSLLAINHPRLLDLVPADFFLFLEVKTTLRGRKFQNINFNKNNITTNLTAVPVDVFSDFYETSRKM
jgi:hypothetical protein